MIEELRLSELLCTRLCHDLTGPIGAVHNGAEFLSEEGFNLQGQAMELIVSSAFSAVTRLQFYRSAYGKVKEHGEASLADKQKLAMDFFIGSKITLDWPDAHTDSAGVSISQRMARLIYNLIIIASGSLIRGGTLSVRITRDVNNNRLVSVGATGPGLKIDEDVERTLSGALKPEALSPKNVQMYLTWRFAQELGANIDINIKEDALQFSVMQPDRVSPPDTVVTAASS